jgi:triacylglycerol lipase
MSIFTTLPRESYDDRAFGGFDPKADGFVLANARAMAWAAQLAYETETPDKMRDVAAAWGFAALEPLIVQHKVATFLTVTDTRGFVAAGDKATVVGFSGTDPPNLANWITNFDASMTEHGGARIHAGFLRATLAARPLLEDALTRLHASGRPLYVVGHSLGAAVAVVAARLIASDAQRPVSRVYAFGMPRTGDQAFAEACGAQLGDRIYRLVHGTDIVPGVPFDLAKFNYRHVGRYLRCPSGGSFMAAELTPGSSSDEPNLGRDALERLKGEFRRASSWRWPTLSFDSRALLKAFVETLPGQIRDHLPDKYIAACARAP